MKIENLDRFKLNFLLFISSFFILTRFQIDPDLGWHLALGEKFLEHGQIVTVDEFSWTMLGYEWGSSYFLYQIFLTFLVDNLGFFIVSILFGAISAISICFVVGKKLDPIKLFFIMLGAAVTLGSLGIRPHTVSFLMFSLLLVFLERKIFIRKYDFILWFFFFFIWANFHRGFLVGILFLTVYIFINYLRVITLKKKVKIWPRMTSIVSAVVGTFLTPFPLLLWKSAIFEDLTSRSNLFSISEWQSIAFFFPLNILFAFSGLVFVFILYKKFKDIEPEWFLLAAFLYALAFVAVTFAFFWAAIFIFLVTRYWDFEISAISGRVEKFFLTFVFLSAASVIFLGTLGNFLRAYGLKDRVLYQNYPVEAAIYLVENDLTRGVFNEYGWGGFIDWQYPSVKVFIDGRMASWRLPGEKGILSDYININSGRCETDRKYDIHTVFVKADSKTDCFSDFVEVYRDDIAKILVKSN